jgi:hypothetical protein
MATKADLKRPAALENDVLDNSHVHDVEAQFLDDSIRAALPQSLLPHYVALISGKKIPPRFKKQIREIVTGIINDA